MGRRITDNQVQSDHDLLLTFRGEMTTKMDFVIEGLEKLSSTVTNDVSALKAGKLDKADFEKWKEEDFIPLRTIAENTQKYVWMAIGVIGFLNIVSILIGIYAAAKSQIGS